MMRINIDPETHALNQQASPAAMLFIFVIIIIRQGLRAEASDMHLNAAFLADMLVVFALGLFFDDPAGDRTMVSRAEITQLMVRKRTKPILVSAGMK